MFWKVSVCPPFQCVQWKCTIVMAATCPVCALHKFLLCKSVLIAVCMLMADVKLTTLKCFLLLWTCTHITLAAVAIVSCNVLIWQSAQTQVSAVCHASTSIDRWGKDRWRGIWEKQHASWQASQINLFCSFFYVIYHSNQCWNVCLIFRSICG